MTVDNYFKCTVFLFSFTALMRRGQVWFLPDRTTTQHQWSFSCCSRQITVRPNTFLLFRPHLDWTRPGKSICLRKSENSARYTLSCNVNGQCLLVYIYGWFRQWSAPFIGCWCELSPFVVLFSVSRAGFNCNQFRK